MTEQPADGALASDVHAGFLSRLAVSRIIVPQRPGSRVGLFHALTADRYALPGVGEADNWTVPTGAFNVEDLIGKYLVKLERADEPGKYKLARTPAPDNQLLLSPLPVAGAISKDARIRCYGPLRPLSNEDGDVALMFGATPMRETFEDKACGNVDDVVTPRSSDSDDGRFR